MYIMMDQKVWLNTLMMQLDSNSLFIQFVYFLTHVFHLEASTMVFVMEPSLFHFQEDASVLWKKVVMLLMELNIAFVLAI